MTALSLKQGEGCPGQRPGWRVDPIHAERGQDARRLHTFLVAGPAAVQLTATYTASRNPVTDTCTGVSLRTLLNQAGLITDPNIKNLHASSSRATPRADATSPTWSHSRFFTAAPVPEPATRVLLIAPLPLLAFLANRRRTFASGQAGTNQGWCGSHSERIKAPLEVLCRRLAWPSRPARPIA